MVTQIFYSQLSVMLFSLLISFQCFANSWMVNQSDDTFSCVKLTENGTKKKHINLAANIYYLDKSYCSKEEAALGTFFLESFFLGQRFVRLVDSYPEILKSIPNKKASWEQKEEKETAWGGCFVGSTPVSTPSGESLIKNIQVGDEVISFNLKTKKFEATKVVETYVHTTEVIATVRIQNSDGSFSNLAATYNHKIYSSSRSKYIPIYNPDLNTSLVGEKVLYTGKDRKLIKGSVVAVTFTHLKKPTKIYDLLVESENHNYFANGILVHNGVTGGLYIR